MTTNHRANTYRKFFFFNFTFSLTRQSEVICFSTIYNLRWQKKTIYKIINKTQKGDTDDPTNRN